MSRVVRLAMLALMVLAGALSASLFTAYRTRPHPTLRQLRAVLFDNWGVYGVFQLNVGLLLAAAWILCVHRRKWVALLWIVGLALVGHIATIAYILWRARTARSIAEVLMPQATTMAADPAAPVIHACRAAFNVELPEPTEATPSDADIATRSTAVEEPA